MELRNKKTGEIRPAEARKDGIYLYDTATGQWYKYELPLLAEYWEYYQEPKEYWYIDASGEVGAIALEDDGPEGLEGSKAIGNYFETKEEAKRAVEKIKAWKRLKDKGFRFEGWYGGSRTIHFSIDSLDKEGDCLPHFMDDDMANDLDLLLGGEE